MEKNRIEERIVELPCTALELETALRAVCDRCEPRDVEIRGERLGLPMKGRPGMYRFADVLVLKWRPA